MTELLVQSSSQSESQVHKTTRRRQFSSCDQCRKGKRGCDILVSKDVQYSDLNPCSNCSRTGKSCTTEWLRSIGQTPHTNRRPPLLHSPIAEAEPEKQRWGQDSWNEIEKAVSPLPEVWDLPLSPASYIYHQNFEFEETSQAASTNYGTSLESESRKYAGNDLGAADFDPRTFWLTEGSIQLSNSSTTTSSLNRINGSDIGFETPISKDEEQTSQNQQSHTAKKKRRYSMPASCVRPNRKPPARSSKRRTSFQSSHPPASPDPSSASLEFRLASSSNKSSISSNLLKIYHDSMENALACWLTERTCPYDVEVKSHVLHAPIRQKPITEERDSHWSNRICERVCKLDKACGILRGRTLTTSENKAVDIALRKSIMSFATQWSYSSRRSSARFPEICGGVLDSQIGGLEDTEFDRSMQEMLWHEARGALEDTENITSFRLVFANIIFALTQRPLDVAKCSNSLKLDETMLFPDSDPGSCPSNWPTPAISPECEKPDYEQNLLENVFELDGPPIFLERALRQMFSYRCKLEKFESQQRTNMKKTRGWPEISSNNMQTPLEIKDRQTFNLLFWLAVMFDTLSAAINKRPLVVSDEDSDILPSVQPQSNHGQLEEYVNFDYLAIDGLIPSKINESELWGEFFFEKGGTYSETDSPRWPCSYDLATSILCEAAPIKVVLFRRITQLQTLLSRRARPQKLEIAIGNALKVHDYWNTKYGPFFCDCISYHDTLPPRIQSWYIVLAGHWHLAGLLLADLIEEIDEMQAGLENHRITRSHKKLVENLRLHNAFAISDLGRCSCPNPNTSFSRAGEFHSAVNEGALLTEPWTEVLIQSFSKACTVLMKMFPQPGYEEHSKFDVYTSRSESCVKALWYLGRKSDIALLACNILSGALKQKVTDLRRYSDNMQHEESNTSEESGGVRNGFSYYAMEDSMDSL